MIRSRKSWPPKWRASNTIYVPSHAWIHHLVKSQIKKHDRSKSGDNKLSMDDQRKAVFSGSLAVGLAMSMLLGLASAQSGCTTVIIGLAPCLSYIAGNASTPSSSCCSQLANVVQSQPACLCSVLNGGASSLGVTVNQTRALALPGACRVQTPAVSECNGECSVSVHLYIYYPRQLFLCYC